MTRNAGLTDVCARVQGGIFWARHVSQGDKVDGRDVCPSASGGGFDHSGKSTGKRRTSTCSLPQETPQALTSLPVLVVQQHYLLIP